MTLQPKPPDGKPAAATPAAADLQTEQLRESEEKYRVLIETTATGFVILDAKGCVLDTNDEYVRLAGYEKREQILGRSVTEWTAAYDQARNADEVKKCVAGGLVRGLEVDYVHPDGTVVPIEVNASTVGVGDSLKIVTLCRDITGRKRAEEEAARMAREWQSTFDATNDAIWILDPNHRVLRSNKTAETFFKRPCSEMLGKPCWEIVHGTTEPIPECPFVRARKSGHRETMDLQQGERWFEIIVDPIFDAAGQYAGAVHIVSDITQRKRAEEAMRDSRALYFSLVENLPQSIFRKDRVGRFQFVNERFCQGLGRSVVDIIGRTDADFFPPELAQAYRKDDLRVMETGRVLDQEEKHVGADGRELFVHVLKTPVRDAQGQIIGIQGVFWNITERKQAEEALYYEQTLMTALMENLPDAVYFKDTASRFLRVNRALSRKFGLSDPAQLVGKSDADFFSGEHARKALADEQEILRTGRPLPNVEEKETWLDGTVSWVVTTKLPLRDAAGRIIGTCGISRDVTERKRAEEALRESQALYHSLVEQLPIGVFRKDQEGRYVLVNPGFCRLKDMKPEDFLGKTPREVAAIEVAKQGEMGLAIKYAAAGVEHHEQIMQTGKPIELVEEYVYADGRKLFLHVIKLPVIGPDGKIIGTQGIQFDITERKRVEEALQDSEEKFRSLFNNAEVGMFRTHLDGTELLDANDKYLSILGRTREEVVGKSSVIFWADPKEREEMVKILKAKGRVNDFECRLLNKAGKEINCLTSLRFYRESGILEGSIIDITDRKRVEQALRESETRFRTLIESSPVAISISRGGKTIYGNRKFLDLYGFQSIDELVGQPVANHWAPEFRAMIMERAQKRARGEPVPSEYEGMGQRKDGSQFPVHISVALVELPDGTASMAFLTDITERKRAEEALQHDEARFRSLATILQHPAPSVQAFLDFALDEAIKLTGSKIGYIYFYHADRKQFVLNTWSKDVMKECTIVNPQTCYELDKTGFWGEAVRQRKPIILNDFQAAHPLKKGYPEGHARLDKYMTIPVFSGGEIVAVVAVANKAGDYDQTDVMQLRLLMDAVWRVLERKRAEEALRGSEAELRAVLESTGDGILAVDRDGNRVIKANRRYAEMWQIPQSIIDAGDNNALRNFVLDQLSDPDAFLKRAHELYNTDTVAVDTLVFKDGRVFERHGFPMMLAGTVLGRVWSFRDITERKRQERELSEKSVELERFTYTVSHDLKSPLVTVKTFLGYLEQDLLTPDTERIKQDVGYMRTAADKMGQLLDELLTLARIGRKMNPPVRVTFQELAQEAVKLVAGHISTSGTEVQVADAAVVLEGDRPRLVEIWQNLVENACKFMGDQPKPRVEIGVEQRGTETVFFVRDNGAGIEPRYREKVFSLFEKLNPKMEGTGMGLALVKRIVELYKGRIWVESDGPGRGANFLFTLPAAVIIEMKASS